VIDGTRHDNGAVAGTVLLQVAKLVDPTRQLHLMPAPA